MLVFGEGGILENPEKSPRSRVENQHKLNPLMASGLGIKPRPHWWKTSALTTSPSLLHCDIDIVKGLMNSCACCMQLLWGGPFSIFTPDRQEECKPLVFLNPQGLILISTFQNYFEKILTTSAKTYHSQGGFWVNNGTFLYGSVISVQSNLDYLDSLGLGKVAQIIGVRIIKNMNINEEEKLIKLRK
ncbi:hypothetical protein AWC38_SpisGene25842 [Stylophora pistillata]|uniref:Uncharacterized protein n=1 Tax=Stylophora pistillata TaxID=50429 RepID=A0A2B4SDB4_STYPI|nr:hypothetical protein AWC38_SpisGene25842 [Stylophora pistillata]